MRSRAARLICCAAALLALAAATLFLIRSERQISSIRADARAFDIRAREATQGMAELRIGQSAYVAVGQGVSFWMPKVADTVQTVTKSVDDLRASAIGTETSAAIEQATAAVAEFGNVDQRARDYLKSGLQLMAGDVIFAEGSDAAAKAARHIETARLAEHRAVDAGEAGWRRQQAAALGGAAAIAALATLLLAPTPRRRDETAAESEQADVAPAGDVFMLREAALASTPSPHIAAPSDGPMLRSAAQLCTDLGRVSDLEELRALLAQAAEIMGASGLVVWMGSADGTELHPGIAHGYSPSVVAQMPRLRRSADNAAAAAFRTGQLQIVLARPGESNGAVVAPLLLTQGSVGALSVEVRSGGEASEAVQALAAIFAAQLAGVIHESPASAGEHESPADPRRLRSASGD